MPAEILIEDEKIIGIAKEFRISNFNEVIDAKKMVAIPAGIDGHVHFRDPGMVYKESWLTGSHAAAAGGIVAVLEHPNTLPPTIDKKGFELKLKQAKKKSVIDFGINGGVTNNLEKLPELWKLGASVFGEIFMAQSTGGLNIDKEILKDALSKIGRMGALACIHAEDDALRLQNEALLLNDNSPDVHSRIRPNECEEMAVRDCLQINQSIKNPANIHFCHISTPEAVALIKNAKEKEKEKEKKTENKTENQSQRPIQITSEVTPHHMFLSTKDCNRLKTLGKMNPPLRSADDAAYMIAALNLGLVDAVSSDHAPHMYYEKETPMRAAPSGVPGVETLMPLMLAAVRKNLISLERMIQVTSQNPARVFNLDRLGKGKMEVGYDADLLLFDPKSIQPIKSKNLHTACDWTPYEGMDGIFPGMTLSRGDVVWDGSQIIAKKGRGKFLPGAGWKSPDDDSKNEMDEDDEE